MENEKNCLNYPDGCNESETEINMVKNDDGTIIPIHVEKCKYCPKGWVCFHLMNNKGIIYKKENVL